MTVAPAATLPRSRASARVAALPAAGWLVMIVAASFLLRLAAALAHTAPRLFPDEYIYAALGRSLGHGSLEIRGQPANFPALLEPLLAAPLWRAAGADLELGYHLVQGMHALAASLVAVPVYLLARRVGLTARWSLFSAALAVALPGMVYVSFISADAVALPLALAAAATGVSALDRPTRRSQVAFVAFAGLAALARIQYVVLPVAFLAASLVVSRGSMRRVARDYRVALALTLIPALAAMATGPARVLGYYRSVLDLNLDPLAMTRWAALDGMFLAYAAGWVMVPVALVGLALGLTRGRNRAERGFAAMTGALAALLLLEASIYASNGSERFQERYLLALLPLVPISFRLGVARLHGRGARIAVALLSGGLFLVATLVPVAEYTVLAGKLDSPTLQAVFQLGEAVGTGYASLAVGLAAGVLAALAALATLTPRLAPVLAVSAGALILGVANIGAIAYDLELTDRVRLSFVPEAGATWVDDARVGPVAILQTPFSERSYISQQLFWNRSIREILRMDESSEVDAFGSKHVTVTRTGGILADGVPVTSPLLVQEYASHAQLEGARLVRRTLNSALWTSAGTPHLATLLAGRYFDGWLGARTTLTVWPRPDGPRHVTVLLTLTLPDGAPRTTLDIIGSTARRVATVVPGRATRLALPIDVSNDPETISLRPRQPLIASGGRLVSVQSTPPRYVERAETP